jgi:hypothetical protein
MSLESRRRSNATYRKNHRVELGMSLESRRRSNATYRKNHRVELRAKKRAVRVALKAEVLARYGTVCAECGFDDPRALQIDHVENNGAEERKRLGGQNFSGWRFYQWLKSQGWPEGYQTLCANHNAIKHCESKVSM